MGAWDYGVFDDDTAYDALDDLQASSNIIADMGKYFDAVLSDSSELKELWEENEELYSAWREDNIFRRERLRA